MIGARHHTLQAFRLCTVRTASAVKAAEALRAIDMVTLRMTTIRRSRDAATSTEHTVVRKRPEVVVKALGKRIRQLRSEKGWSQERLAEEAGMHRTYMWGIEQGMRNPSVRHLIKLADALGLSVKDLFEDV